MATATRTRKPVRRTVRLVLEPSLAWPGILSMRVDGLENDYFVQKVPSNFGDGFRLEKFSAQGGEVYHIHLSDEGHTCDCKGHVYAGHCKHVDALAALRLANKI